jgi:20S proteasome alpha/beta subunit
MDFLYPTSNGDLQPFEVSEVTIGIGILCDGGDTAILASDMRVTYGKSPVPQSDHAGKQYDFSPYLLAATIAGRASTNEAVVSSVSHELAKLLATKKEHPDKLFVSEHVRRIMDFARKQELRKQQECAIEGELGISLSNWQAGNLPNGQKMDDLALRWGLTVLKRVKQELRSQLGLVIIGFAENGIVFMRGIGAEPTEETTTPEYYVVGSGSVAAIEVLTKRRQGIYTTMARSLLHVYEALKAARRREKTVGPPAAYVVVRPNSVVTAPGMWRFPAESPLLRGWGKAWHYCEGIYRNSHKCSRMRLRTSKH